jgi:hypothetical protein
LSTKKLEDYLNSAARLSFAAARGLEKKFNDWKEKANIAGNLHE